MPSELDVYNHLVKVVHLFCGVYIWEFVSTLGFEWEVFTGRRPWKWSFAVYLLARFMALISVILNLVGSSLQTRYNCSAWWRCVLAMSWFSEAVASFLLALRGVAIWGRDTTITSFTLLVWSASIAGSFWSTTRACAISGTNTFRWSLLSNILVDLTLLSIMFAGVLRKKNATHLWRMLYFQSIFWILTATFTEVPSVALGFMNLNDGWNLMFQEPHMVLMVIMSTRLYRDLFQYITNDHDVYGRRRAKVWPHPNVQVAVHKTIEVDVDLLHMDEEHGGKQTISMRSQEEIQMMEEELQMKRIYRFEGFQVLGSGVQRSQGR
ncbi:hypothetical protein BGY98DRAFT_565050 [Russula aff. rugulosa BPL654]|nr:hypothetical protein BGY98DRAFT_565050 [Russula aff. rugulosa BPL654]